MSKLLETVLTATCVASLAATGCIKQDAPPDEIARAIPTAEQVRIKLPNSGKTLGDLANYYVVTRDVTRNLNGGTAWVLILVHTIVQYPVTEISGNTYTWGPWSDTSRYMIGVRLVASATRAIADPDDWAMSLGLEFEPVGALRYVAGIKSWY